jgi:adenosylmethionine---8-amino-7-oxononanoate aminotransferase
MNRSWIEELESGKRQHLWLPYAQMATQPPPLPVAATAGVYLVLPDGRRIIDGVASWWTACHGYNHPHLASAVESQLNVMPHVMFGGIVHEPAVTLATRLATLLPGDLNHVFFSDSGSVAVEVAMKMAVQYWQNRGVSGRDRFVTFRNAYHGDTTGAMSLSDPIDSMHARFRELLLTQLHHSIPTTEEEADQFETFIKARQEEIAGIFIEPLVQAAGGMKFHPPETLQRVAAICRRHDVLLICDEVATGFGRTGSMFAVERAGIVPDITCLGKALTGGTLGMAATVATDRIFEAFLSEDPSQALMHGPTFMANPLACAAANASLDLFEWEPRLEQVAAIEQQLKEMLEPARGLRGIIDVRTRGAIGVIEVERLHHLHQLRQRFLEEGVFIRPFGNVIYVMPSLTITGIELQQLCEALLRVTREWSAW